MAQDKKISKDQSIRYEYVRGLVSAGEVILVFPPLAEPLISYHTRPATNFVATERTERTRINVAGNRVVTHADGSVVSPVLYSLEFRQAWKKITNRS